MCRDWLRAVGLEITHAEETAPLLTNPVRNGSLLQAIAVYTAANASSPWVSSQLGGSYSGFEGLPRFKAPRTVAAARSSLMASLHKLDLSTSVVVGSVHTSGGLDHNTRLQMDVERVLQGDLQTIWGILNHIRIALQALPPNLRINSHGAHSVSFWPLAPYVCTETCLIAHACTYCVYLRYRAQRVWEIPNNLRRCPWQ
jgi:hypothetical protein